MRLPNQNAPVSRRLFAAVLLLVLGAFLSVQALHTHEFSAADHSGGTDYRCSICVAAHSFSPVVVTGFTPVVLNATQILVPTEPRLLCQQELWPVYSIRPPPAA